MGLTKKSLSITAPMDFSKYHTLQNTHIDHALPQTGSCSPPRIFQCNLGPQKIPRCLNLWWPFSGNSRCQSFRLNNWVLNQDFCNYFVMQAFFRQNLIPTYTQTAFTPVKLDPKGRWDMGVSPENICFKIFQNFVCETGHWKECINIYFQSVSDILFVIFYAKQLCWTQFILGYLIWFLSQPLIICFG